MAKKMRKKAKTSWQRPAWKDVGKWLLGLLLFSLIGSGAAWGVLQLQDPDVLPLKVIRIDGDFKHLDRSQLEGAIGSAVKGNFFTVDLDGIREAALDLAWVNQVTVRRIWPDTLKMTVQEEIPLDEQHMLSHLFHQVEQELAEWTRLAAALLARMVSNVAIVTSPKAMASRVKHLEMVNLQESLALLILLFQEAKLKQQLLAFDEMVSQEELNAISRKLGDLFQDMTGAEVMAQSTGLSPVEEQVKSAVVQIMAEEDKRRYEEPYIEGIRHILAQPEFTQTQSVLCLMEMLESKDIAGHLLPEMLTEGGVWVIIGAENREDAMKECSMVITQYGVPGEVDGVLGVIGPRRMPYGRAISSVRYVSSLMSELVAELHTG